MSGCKRMDNKLQPASEVIAKIATALLLQSIERASSPAFSRQEFKFGFWIEAQRRAEEVDRLYESFLRRERASKLGKGG
jgi:hypothetical protein